MRHMQKSAVILAITFGATIVEGLGWFFWLLTISPSEPDSFGQDHQEQWAVTSCWRAIRDGEITSTDQCSSYSQAHLEFFSEHLAADAATTTCKLSRAHLAYTRTSSPGASALISQLELDVRSDCSHPGVS